MSKLICAEFDEFEEALYGVQGHYLLRSRQQRDWRLRVVDLNGVALMLGREGAGTLYSGVGLPEFFNIFLPVSGRETTVVDGQRFDHRRIGWMVPDVMFHIDASRPATWLTVAMSCDLVLRWAGIHEDEFDFSILARNLVGVAQMDVTPLVWLAHRLFHIDEHSPEDLHNPVAEHAARTELMDMVFHTLLPLDVSNPTVRHCLDHRRILREALELLASLEEAPVYLEDLCAATHASERTVRTVFNRYLGMSPHRYLMLYRLHAIRSAIRRAQPGETITSICARYGVWDFGRLARQYMSYFGELPSQALASRPR
ncbi:AraC family transcriptional regulator [Zestomonas carbonaria]|uniref:HTH araC/xylS-type domain-containing protein n=1 Tax=Zestomonas carbonaria TaxID=2762745 RepID=A0A7U7ESZ9_9GAMM|nr:AraC family transcriptional regulator [Pseudomonas carbonaria]CAD5110476.1 hypothetical protein PSEWESI4_04799 [Pseudomonas carbonaria]